MDKNLIELERRQPSGSTAPPAPASILHAHPNVTKSHLIPILPRHTKVSFGQASSFSQSLLCESYFNQRTPYAQRQQLRHLIFWCASNGFPWKNEQQVIKWQRLLLKYHESTQAPLLHKTCALAVLLMSRGGLNAPEINFTRVANNFNQACHIMSCHQQETALGLLAAVARTQGNSELYLQCLDGINYKKLLEPTIDSYVEQAREECEFDERSYLLANVFSGSRQFSSLFIRESIQYFCREPSNEMLFFNHHIFEYMAKTNLFTTKQCEALCNEMIKFLRRPYIPRFTAEQIGSAFAALIPHCSSKQQKMWWSTLKRIYKNAKDSFHERFLIHHILKELAKHKTEFIKPLESFITKKEFMTRNGKTELQTGLSMLQSLSRQISDDTHIALLIEFCREIFSSGMLESIFTLAIDNKTIYIDYYTTLMSLIEKLTPELQQPHLERLMNIIATNTKSRLFIQGLQLYDLDLTPEQCLQLIHMIINDYNEIYNLQNPNDNLVIYEAGPIIVLYKLLFRSLYYKPISLEDAENILMFLMNYFAHSINTDTQDYILATVKLLLEQCRQLSQFLALNIPDPPLPNVEEVNDTENSEDYAEVLLKFFMFRYFPWLIPAIIDCTTMLKKKKLSESALNAIRQNLFQVANRLSYEDYPENKGLRLMWQRALLFLSTAINCAIPLLRKVDLEQIYSQFSHMTHQLHAEPRLLRVLPIPANDRQQHLMLFMSSTSAVRRQLPSNLENWMRPTLTTTRSILYEALQQTSNVGTISSSDEQYESPPFIRKNGVLLNQGAPSVLSILKPNVLLKDGTPNSVISTTIAKLMQLNNQTDDLSTKRIKGLDLFSFACKYISSANDFGSLILTLVKYQDNIAFLQAKSENSSRSAKRECIDFSGKKKRCSSLWLSIMSFCQRELRVRCQRENVMFEETSWLYQFLHLKMNIKNLPGSSIAIKL